MAKREEGDWVRFRELPNLMECDLHWAGETPTGAYWEHMETVWRVALESLRAAQAQGKQFVLFTHGWSTSHAGKTTSRSQIRKLMVSKHATPFILRSQCIQHNSVFVAAIRPQPPETLPGMPPANG
ncbi:MAG: hypothetical protein WAZ34_09570 [Rhodocyclaceae bacterium]